MPNNYYALQDAITGSDWSDAEKAQARQMVTAKGIGPPMPTPPVPAGLGATPPESVTDWVAGPPPVSDWVDGPPPPAAPSRVGQFFQGVGDAAKGLWNAAVPNAAPAQDALRNGNYGQAAWEAAKAATPGYRTLIEPAIDQVRRAVDYTRAGRYSEGAAHGLAALIPGLGPLAASLTDTAVGEPQQRPGQEMGPVVAGQPWRAAGQAATAGALALASGDTAAPVRSAVGRALNSSAESQLYRVLAPTTNGNKVTTAAMVPELLKRGDIASWSRGGLMDRLTSLKDSAGNAVDAAWARLRPNEQVPLQPLLDSMGQHSNKAFLSEKGLPTSTEAENAAAIAKSLQDRLAAESSVNAAGERVVTPTALRQYRQEWDRIASAGNAFGVGVDDGTKAGAHALASNSVRAAINDAYPNIAVANREYSLYKDAADVFGDTVQRRIGQSPSLGQQFARSAGQIGGFLHGGPVGAALGGELLARGTQAGRSVPWSTRAAQVKTTLGGLLQTAKPSPFTIPGLLGNTDSQ